MSAYNRVIMGLISKLREILNFTPQKVIKTSDNFSNVLHALSYIDKLSESHLPKEIGKTKVIEFNSKRAVEINANYFSELFQQNDDMIFPVFFGIYESQVLVDQLKAYNHDASEKINEDKTLNFSVAFFFNNKLELEEEISVFVPANSMLLMQADLLIIEDESKKIEEEMYAIFNGLSSSLSFTEKLEKMNSIIQEKFGLKQKRLGHVFPFSPENMISLDDLILLHSFYSDDLKRALEDPNDNIKQFILGTSKNIDIDRYSNWHQSVMGTVLTPSSFLNARWPSKSEYALSTMQQFSVNYSRGWDKTLNSVKGDINSKVRTINGPPGSGKTTLLKDIFADLIVEQALKMTEFESPDDAFERINSFNITQDDNYPTVNWKMNSKLQGYGIVVASSNNAAVENISKELPRKVDLFQEELSEIDYFKTIYSENYGVEESEISGFFSVPGGKSGNAKKIEKALDQIQKTAYSSEQMNWGEVKACFLIQYNKVQKIKQEIETSRQEQKETGEEIQKFKDKGLNLQDPISVNNAVSLKESSEFQLAKLWFNNDFRTEQSRLFYEAIRVRKAFILSVSQSKKGKIIFQAINIWKNRSRVPDSEAIAIQNAFQIVQLIIPVISSTFASIQNFFKYLGKDSIDNLFIDEAGQALPIQAIGAIWRSKKILAVGDPLQIAPVQPIASYLLSLIAKAFAIDELYTSPNASVQALGDRACPIGTDLSTGWIGIPLWVHRRCLDPMFSISNRISYEEKMVQGAGNKVGAGYWFDVKGKTKLKQFVPEQLVILSNKIEKRLAYKAGKLGITLEDIYVISPFNAVASNVAAIECPKGVSDDIFKKWQKNNVGTVHKFQGKEAKVVFFVIGSDENSEGSIDWAVSTPNLLNVAATRAKNEFYIIGNEDLFSSKQSLDVAHEIFNSSTPDYEYEKLIDYLTSDNLEAPDVLDELVQSDELNLQAIKLWQSKNKDKVKIKTK